MILWGGHRGIFWGILRGILWGILRGILPGILQGLFRGLLQGILWGILQGVLRGILQGRLQAPGNPWGDSSALRGGVGGLGGSHWGTPCRHPTLREPLNTTKYNYLQINN